jgi:mannose-6-phosphate isomerase class I
MQVNIKNFFKKATEETNGLLHLAPSWIPYTFCIPGRRLKLHPDDLYAFGLERGGIDERWFGSTCNADCGPGTKEDDGLSYVVSGKERFLLRDIIEVVGSEVLGDKVMNKWGGLKVFAKFFDNMEALPLHIHSMDEHAREIGMEGKAEAYYFPPQVNMTSGLFPYTFFGLEPGTTKEQVMQCIIDFEKGDNKILEISKAYKLEVETGWLLPAGIFHAPGSLCTFEVQWASDIYSMYQSVVAEKPLEKELLIKDIPGTKKANYIDYLIEMLDWEKNVSPDFREEFYLKPINIGDTLEKGYQEKWIVYGKINNNELFSAKELTVSPGKQAFIKDTGAYGLILIQGHGSINDVKVESPIMIRFGDLTWDEFFVPYNTATKGVKVINDGYEPLVMLKFFGPDCNPDMPEQSI